MLQHQIVGPSAWKRADIRTEHYRVWLDAASLDEIRRVVDEIRAHPLPTIIRSPADFDMPNCHAAMAEVRSILKEGVRFAVVDRLPVEEMSQDEAETIYWLLASMVARPVAQKLDGTMIYNVWDTGKQALPGSGVRPDSTNIEIRFHIDNAYNTTPPEYVGLLCLQTAKSGGVSRVLSFHSVHNRLLAQHKELLPRLYRPFWFDRQREFFDGEPDTFFAPVFEERDELRARFSVHQINSGYAMRGEPVDNEGTAALAAMLEAFEDPEMAVDFAFQPGEIQFVDNRTLGHSRTEFEDWPEPERRRHLIRLWLRDHGRRAYTG
ncbi:MAG: TauD/TfdA family dioxygenase [Alphaproteobacteria bacterium]|nr:TauD/TfdA family dioxygenase [Alphaproteobacteria bacterium]MBV9555263.1 TauD/TfdA family dioxygenase [Alphaproteobacteria bacterium]